MTPSRLFPVFMKLQGEICVVVGGGPVALGKTESLLKAGAIVEVVAPELCDGMRAQVLGQQVQWRNEPFNEEHLKRARLVIAATDDRPVNVSVADAARKIGIPVNVADSPALCSFYMPAVLDRFPLQIAISSGGASPLLARLLRLRLQLLLPHWYSDIASRLGEIRSMLRNSDLDSKSRRRFWEGLIANTSARITDETLNEQLRKSRLAESERQGIVHLIGAGPGDPELLTLKAVRLLQHADAIVYDRLVSEGVLEFARKEAERIFVGKTHGTQSISQEQINSILVSLARQGKTVVRLKGGDPFIFGRGGEECEALSRANIPFTAVPGITAALGCAAATGIPLTHRGLANSLLIVTGRHADEMPKLDWARANRSAQTTVVYMGLCGLKELRENLLKSGWSPRLPAALVQSGTTARQKTVLCTVDNLPESAEAARLSSPVLVILGDVVRLAELHDHNHMKDADVEAAIGFRPNRKSHGSGGVVAWANDAVTAF